MLTNQLRIIGGQWRGRKLDFPSVEGLRPSSDRLRETLFNWLQSYIPQATCLDLFAGSGALGFEAASRGARQVFLCEQNKMAAQQIQANIDKLQTKIMQLYQKDALAFLNGYEEQFDIIFIDPPFSSDLAQQALIAINENRLLKPEGVIFLEQAKAAQVDLAAWQVLKEKTLGQVTAWLLAWQD